MSGSAEKLARVTYLPGVIPPAAKPLVPESVAPPVPSGLSASSPVRPRAQVIEELTQAIEEIESISPEGEGERSARAANVSMHALTRRGMSSAEMTALLRSRDLTAGDVEDEVGRLERVGLLDDQELASNLVRTLHDRKGLGRSAITAELRRRRIEAVAIEEALSGLDDDEELARATEIATKRAPQLRSLDAETARRRLGAFLMRKGYSGGVVSSAVASALDRNALDRNALDRNALNGIALNGIALNGTALNGTALSANRPTARGPRFQ